jgi:hypothetical protein
MPRQFRPKNGFPDSNIVAIQINDDGESHQVQKDGTTKPRGFVGTGRRWQPEWTIEELENLVAGGRWEEITAPQVADATGDPKLEKPANPAPAHVFDVEPALTNEGET